MKSQSASSELLGRIPARVAFHYSILPLSRVNGRIQIAAPGDLSRAAREEIRVLLDAEIEFVSMPQAEIEDSLAKLYGVGAATIETLTFDRKGAGLTETEDFEFIDQDKKAGATVAKLVNELILDALNHRASDIHIEPFEKKFRIRYRIDGLLHEAPTAGKIYDLAPSVISRIKIMASLDIGERRLPQDGRIKIRRSQEELDLRVSVLPSSTGEAIVIRILKPLELLELEQLGYEQDTIQAIRRQLRKPHGMILLTGPTGSGKTTTLYACLKELNSMERKIITIEDPIEYKLPGVVQVQVQPAIGLTFARALRSMLRHDPDCMMVGEIRDQETAEITIRSALTGHLVLSTLHTNDASSALTRLIEIGIEPFLVASCLHAVIAQRLVRCSCNPCEKCNFTGFYGRTAIHELLAMTDSLRALILQRAPARQIHDQALKEGMAGLAEAGRKKVQQNVTIHDEIQRVLI